MFTLTAEAVCVHSRWGDNREEVAPIALPPEGVSFPIVIYLIDDGYNFFYSSTFYSYSKKSIVLPEYLGYVLVDKNFHLTFVKKAKRPVALSYDVERLNAKPAGSTCGTTERHKYFSVLRWSWNFIEEMIVNSNYLGGYTMYVTMGISPDDNFMPKVKETRKYTMLELKQYKKKDTERLKRSDSNRTAFFLTTFTILNSPFEGKVPFSTWSKTE